MTKVTKEKKVFERTISEVLFEQIKYLRRTTDAAELETLSGFSRPVIDKFLNYGHVKDANLEKIVIDFYVDRAKEHHDAEIKIMNLLTHKNKK